VIQIKKQSESAIEEILQRFNIDNVNILIRKINEFFLPAYPAGRPAGHLDFDRGHILAPPCLCVALIRILAKRCVEAFTGGRSPDINRGEGLGGTRMAMACLRIQTGS
jgi:hypothetical protein